MFKTLLVLSKVFRMMSKNNIHLQGAYEEHAESIFKFEIISQYLRTVYRPHIISKVTHICYQNEMSLSIPTKSFNLFR